jgi:hypothetical protein
MGGELRAQTHTRRSLYYEREVRRVLRRFEGLKGEMSIVGNGGEKGSDGGRLWGIGMGEFYCLGARWTVEREVRVCCFFFRWT